MLNKTRVTDYRLRKLPKDVSGRRDIVAAEWKRREKRGDPDYVLKRRKEFERNAARLRAEKAAKQAAPADPGPAAEPGGNPVEGGASLAAIAESRLQRRRKGGD